MPTYQYACTECGHAFEQFQSFSDDALTECPQCEGRLRKLFNAVGVVFKGSGFYRTDSRSGSGKADQPGSGSSSDGGSAASSDGGSGKGSTSGSGTSGGSGKDSGSSTGGSANGSSTSGKPAAASAAS